MTKTRLLVSCTVLACLCLFVSIFKGSTPLKLADPALIHDIVYFVRLPHTLCAFVTGGLLALSGALMQVLLRNPLADPYVLGISGGTAVMTLCMMLVGLSGIWLPIGAWAGSLCSVLLVISLTPRKPSWAAHDLLLTGIIIACGFSAIISLILLISPPRSLHSMLFWLTGDLNTTHIPSFEACILLLGLLMSLSVARELNILVRGEREALSLGVNTHRLQWKLYLLSSLLTATAVSLAGCIGFVGLIVPHLLRLLGGHDHRYLLPSCVLLGGSLLTIADFLARTAIAPQQLPVGMMMALLGIPVFLVILRKSV